MKSSENTVRYIVVVNVEAYMKQSYLYCFLNPRNYTVYNRRKDVICDNPSLLMKELKCICILQGIPSYQCQ